MQVAPASLVKSTASDKNHEMLSWGKKVLKSAQGSRVQNLLMALEGGGVSKNPYKDSIQNISYLPVM